MPDLTRWLGIVVAVLLLMAGYAVLLVPLHIEPAPVPTPTPSRQLAREYSAPEVVIIATPLVPSGTIEPIPTTPPLTSPTVVALGTLAETATVKTQAWPALGAWPTSQPRPITSVTRTPGR